MYTICLLLLVIGWAVGFAAKDETSEILYYARDGGAKEVTESLFDAETHSDKEEVGISSVNGSEVERSEENEESEGHKGDRQEGTTETAAALVDIFKNGAKL